MDVFTHTLFLNKLFTWQYRDFLMNWQPKFVPSYLSNLTSLTIYLWVMRYGSR